MSVPLPRVSRRTMLTSASGLVFAGLVHSSFATHNALEGDAPHATPATPVSHEFTLAAFDFGFDPFRLTILADTQVTITYLNDGVVSHNLVISELGIRTSRLRPGEQATFTLKVGPGTWEYYCAVSNHREAGMTGKLIAE